MKVVDTRIGYSLFMLTDKSVPVKKVKAAVLTRSVVPSNQTYQDIYLLASTFAGQNKTPEAFEKSATAKGLQKRSAPNVRGMDGYLMGLPSAREMVRWAFAEPTKINEVSPVFDLGGKYAVAILKSISEKGQQPLEAVKARIEPSVKSVKKIEIMAEKMKKTVGGTKDIASVATQLGAKLDTAMVTFSGFGRSNIGREAEIVGQLFNAKKGDFLGPLTGNYGAYYVMIDDIVEAPAKEDFTFEKMQQVQNFNSRVTNNSYTAIEKIAKITDNRLLFY
jgi:peptidyl-prolyl cis-trans isomerase D